MAKSLSAFLSQNAKPVEHKEVVISDRFLDVDGEPIKWEIKSITAAENQRLRDQAQKITVGAKKQQIVKFDNAVYQTNLATKCVVFPDLNNVELQNSYHAMNAAELIGAMLTPAEFDDLVNEILLLCGFEDDNERVEEAKN